MALKDPCVLRPHHGEEEDLQFQNRRQQKIGSWLVETYRVDGMVNTAFHSQTASDHPDQGKKFPSEQRVIVAVDIGYHRALQMWKARVGVMINRLDVPLWKEFRVSKPICTGPYSQRSRSPCSESLYAYEKQCLCRQELRIAKHTRYSAIPNPGRPCI
ncbi:hypothetical protein VTN77DRAFT_4460 [Rasamsonia byssochlamydoides]|uniref:uncharacterized protein n=1 Tax=Rasamsonia byssochlamydoides TaxID=89139 RepID=UPI0037441C0D